MLFCLNIGTFTDGFHYETCIEDPKNICYMRYIDTNNSRLKLRASPEQLHWKHGPLKQSKNFRFTAFSTEMYYTSFDFQETYVLIHKIEQNTQNNTVLKKNLNFCL